MSVWNWRHRLEYLLFRLIVCVIDALSPRVTARAAESLAFVIHDCLPRRWSRFAVARENLRRAFGDQLSEREIDRTVYRMWVHLFRMVAEMVQSSRKVHLHSYRDIIDFVSHRPTVEAMCSGRRVLLLSGHFGNWEAAITIFGLWDFPMGVIAREMDNPYLHDWFARYRESTGHRLLLKKGDFDEMLTLLQRGGHVGLLGDQDAGSRGLFVDFFGVPASTFKSIALLAIEYDALIVVGSTMREADDFASAPWVRFSMHCDGVYDPRDYPGSNAVREITQDYTSALETAIRRAPEQYFWVHRRWKSEPRVRRKAA